ncbi:hypothetical protein LJC56_03265 [Christensenellaceae bacterium OttesenSCG-928-K19]|nr:hypothetical protein [Christensenellaceae bacterium OttesenSCG-928-K19]
MKKILVQNFINDEVRDCPYPEKCLVYIFTGSGSFICRGTGTESMEFLGEYLVLKGAVANANMKVEKTAISYDHISAVSVNNKSEG